MARPPVSDWDPSRSRSRCDPDTAEIACTDSEPRHLDVYLADSRDYFTNINITNDTSSCNSSVRRLDLRAIPEKQKLGYLPVASLIINNMVGVGIFISPGIVLQCTGNKGGSLLLWSFVGGLTLAGAVLFVELGVYFPYSGGEFIYLNAIYHRPRYFVGCIWATIFVLLNTSTGNAILISDFMISAVSRSPTSVVGHDTRFRKAMAVLVMTVAILMVYLWGKIGRRVNNALAVYKILFLSFIILTGLAVLCGAKMHGVGETSMNPGKENLENMLSDATFNPYLYGSAFSSATCAFQGWEVGNYILAEVKGRRGSPKKVYMRAAFGSILGVTILYIAVNISFFCVLTTDEIIDSDLFVVAHFFVKVFGINEFTTRGLKILVAISAFGNILAVAFACAKVKQEMAMQGVLPFSSFFARNSRFGSPTGGLILHWIFGAIALLAVPFGRGADTIAVLLNLSYCAAAWGYAALGFGFLTIPYNPKFKDWVPEVMRFRFLAPLAVLFGSSYLILIVVMWWPVNVYPDGSAMKAAFWVAPLAGSGVLIAGALYYLAYAALLPALGFGIAVSLEEYSDGSLVVTFKHVTSVKATKFMNYWKGKWYGFLSAFGFGVPNQTPTTPLSETGNRETNIGDRGRC